MQLAIYQSQEKTYINVIFSLSNSLLVILENHIQTKRKGFFNLKQNIYDFQGFPECILEHPPDPSGLKLTNLLGAELCLAPFGKQPFTSLPN